ncbi:hypothetical protein BD414DRAFT_477707 [Trametes punicea]|nr:hypothetical protein BD414DRAFT_477707 [Trametes punicea]
MKSTEEAAYKPEKATSSTRKSRGGKGGNKEATKALLTTVTGEDGATQIPGNDMTDIRQRLAFLCHDLRTFSAREDAALRLNSSVHAHFLGPPYLSEGQAEFVKGSMLSDLRPSSTGPSESQSRQAGKTDSGADDDSQMTLAGFLDRRMAALVAARRAKGEDDFVLCTSHDLAPLLQEACGLSKQDFETRAFRDAYKRWEKEVRKGNKKGKAMV